MSERGGWTGEERGGRRDGADVLLGLGSYRSDGSTRRRRRWDRGELGFTLAFGGGEGRAREGGRSRVDVELNADLVIVSLFLDFRASKVQRRSVSREVRGCRGVCANATKLTQEDGGTGKYIIERERVVKENGWELELE